MNMILNELTIFSYLGKPEPVNNWPSVRGEFTYERHLPSRIDFQDVSVDMEREYTILW